MANKYKDFQEVPVWQSAHRATLRVYILTKGFPREETYGLVSQIRRSASSIPANIAEGFYRNTTKELVQFLYNARGSCGETIYHLILSKDLNYINEKEFYELEEIYIGIVKQLNGWIASLKKRISH